MTGVKEVRKHNEQQFINDFKSIYSFVVITKYSWFFEVLKSDVWSRAKTHEIMYEIRTDLYVRNRKSMVIL